MASIPLPALAVREPNPLEAANSIASLAGFAQRQKLGQQQLQNMQLETQQRQLALQDQQAMTTAMKEWDGKSYNDLPGLVLKHGGSAQAVFGLKGQILDQQTKVAALDKDTLATQQGHNDVALGALQAASQVPDEQLPQHIVDTTTDLINKGHLPPTALARAQQIAQLPPDQARAQLSLFEKGLMGAKEQFSQAQESQKTAATVSEAASKAQEAATRAAEFSARVNPQSPLYAPSPAAVAMGTAPGAAQIQTGEARLAGAKASAEAAAKQPFEIALAKVKQAITQGDPTAAAQLLVNRDATLSQLKARGVTPDFIQKTLQEATRLSGGTFNAQQAEAEFDVAKSPANTAFFGSAKSLTDPGGTLDQLAEISKKIPQHDLQFLNKLEDWEKAATGSGPIAKYASVALGASDDYSKVMGGGQGSDASRSQGLQLLGGKLSPEQRAQSIEGIRGAVNSQMNGRIGNNNVLKRMYGNTATNTPKTYTQADVDAAIAAHPGLTAAQAEAAFKAKDYVKR
jgi:hypothetical protein